MDISEGPFQAQISLRNPLVASVKLHHSRLLLVSNPTSLTLSLSYLLILRAFPVILHTTSISVSVSHGIDHDQRQVTDAYFDL